MAACTAVTATCCRCMCRLPACELDVLRALPMQETPTNHHLGPVAPGPFPPLCVLAATRVCAHAHLRPVTTLTVRQKPRKQSWRMAFFALAPFVPEADGSGPSAVGADDMLRCAQRAPWGRDCCSYCWPVEGMHARRQSCAARTPRSIERGAERPLLLRPVSLASSTILHFLFHHKTHSPARSSSKASRITQSNAEYPSKSASRSCLVSDTLTLGSTSVAQQRSPLHDLHCSHRDNDAFGTPG